LKKNPSGGEGERGTDAEALRESQKKIRKKPKTEENLATQNREVYHKQISITATTFVKDRKR